MPLKKFRCYATTSRGIEPILQDECRSIGAEKVEIGHSGVHFVCALPVLYKICLSIRTANRILLEIGTGTCNNEEELYRFARSFPWEAHMDRKSAFSISASSRDRHLSHTSYAALQLKDGLVDHFREHIGQRPSVWKSADNPKGPDIAFHGHIEAGKITVYLDWSGGSLHQRGYRKKAAEASLKEHVAAAMLLASGWKETVREGGALVDLMCGAGTIPIEGALIAYNIPPGIYRTFFGFSHWKQHRPDVWEDIRSEAAAVFESLQADPPDRCRIAGYDHDENLIAAAVKNAGAASVSHLITFTRKGLHEHTDTKQAYTTVTSGLICTNPPYGIRLGDTELIPLLYQEIGRVLKRTFPGWRASFLVPDGNTGKHLGLQADSIQALSNGEIHGKLIQIVVSQDNNFRIDFPSYANIQRKKKKKHIESHIYEFQNRLVKNKKKYSSYLKKESITCYRIYDADNPEYSAAIDIYGGYAYIQEYPPPPSVPREKARFRLIEIVQGVTNVFNISKENIYIARRKNGAVGAFVPVRENGLIFLVNFVDYPITGLSLEHRELRKLFRNQIKGKRFLQLFSAAGTASVCAASGGAAEVFSVDAHENYLDWEKENWRINGLSMRIRKTVCMDGIAWLAKNRTLFDCIFVDPPGSIVEKDCTTLLELGVRSLLPKGVLYFTTRTKGVEPDPARLTDAVVSDMTDLLIPPDFATGKSVYRCYRLIKKAARD